VIANWEHDLGWPWWRASKRVQCSTQWLLLRAPPCLTLVLHVLPVTSRLPSVTSPV